MSLCVCVCACLPVGARNRHLSGAGLARSTDPGGMGALPRLVSSRAPQHSSVLTELRQRGQEKLKRNAQKLRAFAALAGIPASVMGRSR